MKCVPGDPATMCPVLFKGSPLPAVIGLMLHSLLYVLSLSCKAVLSAMLAVLCCICGYGIVCPSLVYAGLSLFIMCGLYVNMVVCIVYAYNLAWGGPEKWQKRGRAKRVLSRFCRLIIKSRHILERSTFKFEVFREIFCFVFRLVYSQSISDRFSAHVRPVIQVAFQHVFQNMCTII